MGTFSVPRNYLIKIILLPTKTVDKEFKQIKKIFPLIKEANRTSKSSHTFLIFTR